MSKSIKFLMVVLVLAAGFAVFRILFLFSRQLDIAGARHLPVEVEYDESNDYDHDGLSNTDEAYWNTDPFNPDTDGDGFLDGEEVLSGRDPADSAIAGNDSLAERSKLMVANLTTGVADLVVAGLAAGDLKKTADDQTFTAAVDRISLAAIYDALDVLENISLQDEIFKIVEPTKENQQDYINKISEIIEDKLMSIMMRQPQEFNRFFVSAPDIFDNPNQTKIKNTYLSHASKFQESYQELFEYPVPRNLIETHKEALLIIKKIEMHFRSIALSNDDPLKMMVVIANLQTIYVEAQPILNKITRHIKKNNLISPNSEIFQAVDALHNP